MSSIAAASNNVAYRQLERIIKLPNTRHTDQRKTTRTRDIRSARIEGGTQGDGAPLLFFFFFFLRNPNIFFTGTGDATFILIDIQNNFYVNFNLRQLENEFYDLYQNYFYN
jgi:hypothetical protein